MSELSKNLWAVFFVSVFCGVWTLPVIIVFAAVYYLAYIRWPWLVNRKH